MWLDVTVFATGILTAILTFVITYMLCAQSKLKSMVANNGPTMHQDNRVSHNQRQLKVATFELMQLLIILNLVMTALLIFIKLKKSKVFQGHLFTNMVKINLFLANTQSYVPLEVNSAAENVRLF